MDIDVLLRMLKAMWKNILQYRLLVKKKYLSSKQAGIGRTHEYEALLTEEEYQKNQVKELFEFWGKGQMNNTLTALFSEKGMEKESVELVKKWVDELDF